MGEAQRETSLTYLEKKKKYYSLVNLPLYYFDRERHFNTMLQDFTSESLGEAGVLLSYNKENKTQIVPKAT